MLKGGFNRDFKILLDGKNKTIADVEFESEGYYKIRDDNKCVIYTDYEKKNSIQFLKYKKLICFSDRMVSVNLLKICQEKAKEIWN